MLLAMCADTGMLLMALFWLLLVGVACCALFVLGLILFLKWLNNRRGKLEAEPSPAANA